MTDKEKRELKDGVISIFKRFNILDHTATIGGLRDDILRYIDSLQEEPVSKEIGDYDHKAVMESLCPQLKEEPTIPDIVDEHFWKMLGEEPVSEDLEEACEQLAENARKHKAETSSPFFSQTDYRQGVIDGAKWQKEQMMAKAFDGEILENYDGKVIEYDDTILDEKLSDCKVFDKVKIIVIKEG